jgi:hypothetical protein
MASSQHRETEVVPRYRQRTMSASSIPATSPGEAPPPLNMPKAIPLKSNGYTGSGLWPPKERASEAKGRSSERGVARNLGDFVLKKPPAPSPRATRQAAADPDLKMLERAWDVGHTGRRDSHWSLRIKPDELAKNNSIQARSPRHAAVIEQARSKHASSAKKTGSWDDRFLGGRAKQSKSLPPARSRNDGGDRSLKPKTGSGFLIDYASKTGGDDADTDQVVHGFMLLEKRTEETPALGPPPAQTPSADIPEPTSTPATAPSTPANALPPCGGAPTSPAAKVPPSFHSPSTNASPSPPSFAAATFAADTDADATLGGIPQRKPFEDEDNGTKEEDGHADYGEVKILVSPSMLQGLINAVGKSEATIQSAGIALAFSDRKVRNAEASLEVARRKITSLEVAQINSEVEIKMLHFKMHALRQRCDGAEKRANVSRCRRF